MEQLNLATKLAEISEKNNITPKYNDKRTWTKTMLFNYQQIVEKAEAAAENGKRKIYIDTQFSSESAREHIALLKCLRDIDEFKVTSIKLRGTGVEPHIDFESTLKLEW